MASEAQHPDTTSGCADAANTNPDEQAAVESVDDNDPVAQFPVAQLADDLAAANATAQDLPKPEGNTQPDPSLISTVRVTPTFAQRGKVDFSMERG